MTHRNHRSGSSLTWMFIAAILLAVPLVASADHDERRRGAEVGRRDDGYRARERVDARRYYDDGGYRSGHHASDRATHQRHVVRKRGQHRHQHAAPFYCRPCRHRFASKSVFHRHLHRRHHVAPWRISRRVVRNAFGWIFFG